MDTASQRCPALRILWRSLSVALLVLLIAGSVAAQETPDEEPPLTPSQQRAIRLFADGGILTGTSCTIRSCSGPVQRWEVALWMLRLLNGEPASTQRFTDIDFEQSYAGHVEALFDLGVTIGCAADLLQYCPDRDTRRGEMAAFVTRAFDFDDTTPPHGFSDVPRTNVFRNNISALKNSGVDNIDCGDDLFCPEDPIVAARAVEWLYRAARIADPTSIIGGGGGGSGGGGGGGSGGSGGDIPPPTTTLPPDFGGPGGPGIDIGPDGECTHWGTHVRQQPGFNGQSFVLLDGGHFYAHKHDDYGDGMELRWWYWDPANSGDLPPIQLMEGDSRIPCHHAECPTDHVHDSDEPTYEAGAHHFGEGNERNRDYFHDDQDDEWTVDGVDLMYVEEGPCTHPDDGHLH